MSGYHVLDLFCGLGGFSSAFEDSERCGLTPNDPSVVRDDDAQSGVEEWT